MFQAESSWRARFNPTIRLMVPRCDAEFGESGEAPAPIAFLLRQNGQEGLVSVAQPNVDGMAAREISESELIAADLGADLGGGCWHSRDGVRAPDAMHDFDVGLPEGSQIALEGRASLIRTSSTSAPSSQTPTGRRRR